VTLLYFAWLRQKIGRGEERIELPASVKTVTDLVAYLRARGPGYTDAFADMTRLRVAINQEHSSFDAALGADDEVAFFPPVTGG
jgi:molybdopterin synthase sulfur carrier subunit